jgi:hypothetical protein
VKSTLYWVHVLPNWLANFGAKFGTLSKLRRFPPKGERVWVFPEDILHLNG